MPHRRLPSHDSYGDGLCVLWGVGVRGRLRASPPAGTRGRIDVHRRPQGRSADGGRGCWGLLYASVGGSSPCSCWATGFCFSSPTPRRVPRPSSPAHEHGLVSVEYDGETLDFADPRYLENDECFHFHAGADDRDGGEPDHAVGGAAEPVVWHVHCEDVTLEYAFETLGIEPVEDARHGAGNDVEIVVRSGD